jgi:hypothetical protein
MIEDGLAAFASEFQYCEISRFGAITQPMNVMSNLGFLIVFFISWYRLGLRSLTVSALLIFIGSSLWHATLHPVGLLFDIMPIFLWVILFLWEVTKHSMLTSHRWFMIMVFLFVSLMVTQLTADIIPMRSGIFVVGSFLLFMAGCFIYKYNRQYAFLLVSSSFWLVLAIIARLIDVPLCDYTPWELGTHWLWHLFASFALVPLVKLLSLVDKK